MSHYTDDMVEDGMANEATTPAPMTAERLAEARRNFADREYGWQATGSWRACAGDLLSHIDALTARIAELEREGAETEQLRHEENRKVCKWMDRALAAEGHRGACGERDG